MFSNVKYSAIVPISIHKTYQISQLIKEIENNLPIQSKIYDSNFLTDKSLTFRACEIIREKTLRLVGDELPYKINVHMDRFIEKNDDQEKPDIKKPGTKKPNPKPKPKPKPKYIDAVRVDQKLGQISIKSTSDYKWINKDKLRIEIAADNLAGNGNPFSDYSIFDFDSKSK